MTGVAEINKRIDNHSYLHYRIHNIESFLVFLVMYVCLCKGVTDTQIRAAVEDGAGNVRAVRKALGVSTQCGQCACQVKDLVKESLTASMAGSDMFYSLA